MIIKKVEFKTSIQDPKKYLEISKQSGENEICVVGRSNVGKSSFINMITKRKKIARTSSTPGRTRLVNLFDINNGQFTIVDLPGYGYAQASKKERDSWDQMIEGYLLGSTKLKHCFLLVDIRHEPTQLDIVMAKYLYHYNIPFSILATKSDKITKAQIGRSVQTIATAIGVGRDNIIPISSVDNYGYDKVLDKISKVLNLE